MVSGNTEIREKNDDFNAKFVDDAFFVFFPALFGQPFHLFRLNACESSRALKPQKQMTRMAWVGKKPR